MKRQLTMAILSTVSCMVLTSDTEVVVLRAVRGRSARLPCGQGKVFLDGPQAYVVWFKNDKDFLYRYPNEDSQKSSQWRDAHDQGCAIDDSGCDGTSLFIKQITDHDGGLYRCRVHYQASASQDYVIDIRLVDAPGIPKIYNENDEQITANYVGPYNLGADFTLICEVEEGESDTLVYWRRNGVVIERVGSVQSRYIRAVVSAINITRDELNAHYECVAHNADITEPVSRSLLVKMYLPPLSVEIRLNNNVNFEVGTPRLVDCVVVGCAPPPAITWHLDDQMLRPTVHKEVHEGNYTVSTLSLTPSMGPLARTLRCRTHHAQLSHRLYQDNITIYVGYRPVCGAGVQDNSQPGASTHSTKCEVDAMPAPTHYTWSFSDGRTLLTAVNKVPGKIHHYTSSVTWVPREGDTALLSCRATNIFGEQKRACEYTVRPRTSPKSPECKLSTTLPDHIILQCENELNNNRPQTVHVQVLSEDGSVLYNSSNSFGNFHLTKLPLHTTNLSVKVYAANSEGISPPVYLRLNSLDSLAASGLESGGSNMWVWLAASICALAIVALALMALSTIVQIKEADSHKDTVTTTDGIFHREPELERDDRAVGTTNITVNQLAACPNQKYSSSPMACRVHIGCSGAALPTSSDVSTMSSSLLTPQRIFYV